MAQFDVYLNLNDATKEMYPYLLDVQHPLHRRLSTRLIVPLAKSPKKIQSVTPQFEIEGERFVAMVPEVVGISKVYLGKKVASLETESSKIINAIDFLLTGF